MARRIVALAIDTGTMPSQWFAELERDERNVVTALDIIASDQEKQNRKHDADGRQMSG